MGIDCTDRERESIWIIFDDIEILIVLYEWVYSVNTAHI